MSKKYALIGEKLSHSISPYIHSQLFNLYSFDASYELIEISKESFNNEVQSLKNLSGFNITIPYKETIMQALSSIDETARDIGSVNTVACGKAFKGFNTDYKGFLHALKFADIPLRGKVLILGYGGFSKMAVYAALQNGCDITVYKRNKDSSKHLKKDPKIEYNKNIVNFADDLSELHSFDFIINGTPVGMHGFSESSLPLPKEVLLSTKYYFDAIYNPPETAAIKLLEENHIKTSNGLSMLVWQAAFSHYHWNKVTFDPADIEQIIKNCKERL